MSLKKRIRSLEHQPAKHTDDEPKETALQSATRIIAKIRKERAADPEGCERRRRERLRADGWPEGYNPTASEILQRILERRTN